LAALVKEQIAQVGANMARLSHCARSHLGIVEQRTRICGVVART
jgi:hypothetical protein